MTNPTDAATFAAEKEALLALLLAEEGLDMAPVDTITPRPQAADPLLSFAQRRLWYLSQLEPHSPTYNVSNAVRLTGQLNVATLQQSLSEVVRRHEVLRTIFPTVEGRPVPMTLPMTTARLAVGELHDLPEPERSAQAEQLVMREARRPFDLAHGPLVRGLLLWLGAQEYVLLLTMHHIVSDAWSRSVLTREVAALYTAYTAGVSSPLPELAIQYADFAHWQRQWLQGAVLETQLTYWKQQLGDGLPVLELPTDRPRPVLQTSQGTRQSFVIPQRLTAALRMVGQQEGATVFMTLLAAFQTLLHRYTGQDDIAVGTPIAHRTSLETEGLIGFFVNTLVLRTTMVGNPSFRELLRRVREVTLAAHTYQDVPFELLVDALRPARDPGHTPLFQVLFVFQHAAQEMVALPGLTLSPLRADSGTAKFDLTLTIIEAADGLTGWLEYRTELFDAPTITRLLGHFTTLLAGISVKPDQRLADIPLLQEVEQYQLLVAWNATTAASPHHVCLQQLVEAQVQRTPDAIAVACEDAQLTYADLNCRANQLARHLRALGVGPEVRVGIALERSLEMVVGLLGILKAGGAYVPLDPDYPAERLAFMLADTQAPVLLTQDRLKSQLPEHGAQVICLDSDWTTIAREHTANPVLQTTAAHVAYVMYTSGSTGKPKGVMIPHGGICNRLLWVQETYPLTAADRVLQKTPYSFDVSVWEFFWPLMAGARLVVARPGGHRDSAYLVDLIASQQITTLHFVPSMLSMFLAEPGLTVCRCLRQVMCSGEALPVELQERFFARLDAALYNLYGPTEASVEVTCWACQRQRPMPAVPMGRPIANTHLYVLDSHRSPVPIGVPGELYIGGAGLARGYLNRPEWTAETFIPDPFSSMPGARLYQTGDVVRYLPDGNLVFLGRNDQQVKIRGFRIELGEIEAVLDRHVAVREAVVVAREDGPGDKRLVAYVVAHPGQAPTLSELRRCLQAQVPDYMVPAAFMLLETLPLTPSGKVDRRALPVPDHTRAVLEGRFVAARTPAEALLARIWCQVLGLEYVGIHDNFFALGGDSILSLQIIARAHLVGLRLTPRHIFQHQTIAELAAVADMAPALHAPQGPVTGPVPLTPIQRWFFASHPVDVHHFNQAVLLHMQPAADPALIEQALQHVLWYHEAFRLRYRHTANGWQQESVDCDASVPYYHIDVSALAEAEHSRVIEAVATTLQASLHLGDGPLVRSAYFTLGAHQPGRLLLVIHHLAVDGVSWRILLTDLHQACEHLRRGETIQLAPQTTSFKAWAERLCTYAQTVALRQELDYWRILPHTPVCRLPVDAPGHPNTVASAGVVTVALSPEETRALLQDVPQVYHTQINDVLLTALVQAFARWTGSHTLLLDLEGHGREALFDDVDLSRTVGWFTTIFPVLLELEAVATPVAALLAVKEQLRRLPHHGIGYGILRYLSQDEEITQALCVLPQAEVCFNYLGQLDQVLPALSLFTLAREAIGPRQSPRGTRRYLLEINGSVSGEQLQLHWTYSDNVHRRDTIVELAQGFLEALRGLITHCQSATAGGYTSADFPLAQLGQQQLEQAFDEIAFAGEED